MIGGVPNDLFETIKVLNGRIQLADLHFERLFNGLKELKFSLPPGFSREKLEHDILTLCREKNCEGAARVRLAVTRDAAANTTCFIECWKLDRSILYEQNLKIDIYTDERKDNNIFSHLKSTCFTCYRSAANYAKQKGLDDCILFNYYEKITDSSISNIFLIKAETVYTPLISDGCIDGVMRKYLLRKFRDWNIECTEAPIDITGLFNADELFLTNAIRGIRSVKEFRDKTYNKRLTEQIVHKLREVL